MTSFWFNLDHALNPRLVDSFDPDLFYVCFLSIDFQP